MRMDEESKMNIQDGYVEEDLFPKIFTEYEERDYGILFYTIDVIILTPRATFIL